MLTNKQIRELGEGEIRDLVEQRDRYEKALKELEADRANEGFTPTQLRIIDLALHPEQFT